MRIINFEMGGQARLGVKAGEELVDLSVAAPQLPTDMVEFLAAGPAALATAQAAAASAKRDAYRSLSGLRYLPTVQRPSKIICLGVNYLEHAAEAGEKAPEFPPIFMRGPSSLVAHQQPLLRPANSIQLDYEAELAVIIGKTAKHLSKANALSYVAGYSVFNDGSIRDFQLRTSQWTLGKNFDATGGLGPELVTADELPPGGAGLRLQARLNGNVMQDSNTGKMIFDVAASLAILTECITLYPGDVIATGTCAGVGLLRKPPVFMKQGDRCEIEIEGVGVLVNPIADEKR